MESVLLEVVASNGDAELDVLDMMGKIVVWVRVELWLIGCGLKRT